MGLLADCRNFPVMANKVSTALVPTSPLTNPAWWWYVCFFRKAIPWNSCTVGDRGDGTAGKVLVAQAWAPPFSPPNLHEEPGVGLPTYNPSSGEAETSRSLGLTGQSNFQVLGQIRGPVRKTAPKEDLRLTVGHHMHRLTCDTHTNIHTLPPHIYKK